jgi:exopolysaccharide production protein ExoZ
MHLEISRPQGARRRVLILRESDSRGHAQLHRGGAREWLAQHFELARGGNEQNVRPMEGLRGFAVFLVFLVHYVTLARPWIGDHPVLLMGASRIHALGNTGVDLFFVLSGFLIYGTLIARPHDFLRFMARRVERIYPAFIAVFVLYVALSLVFPNESKIPADLSNGLLYLLANFLLLPGIVSIEPMITVAWSLSYEMFFYLVMPLVVAGLGLRQRSPAWRVAFFVAVAMLIAVYGAAEGGHVRLIMFISGVLLYEASKSFDVPSPGSAVGLLALLAGLSSATLPVYGTAGATLKIGILFVAFLTLTLVCFQAPGAWLSRCFSWTPLRWLGNMSYSYYLLHGLALKAAFLVLGWVAPAADHASWIVFWGLLPVMFVLTLVPTTVLFLLVERPFSLVKAKGTRT